MADDFALAIGRFAEMTTKQIHEVRKEAQKEIIAGTISDTPVDTGRARMNWIASKDGPANYSMNLAVAGGNPVAAAQAQAFGEDGTLYFVNNVEYAYYLEFGTPKMRPRAMARTNLQRVADNIKAKYG